jgi:YfiH family protein
LKIRWKDCGTDRPQIRKQGEVVWLSFPSLERTGIVAQGFSTRLGGASRGIFASMNLSFTRGDEEEAVRENFRRISGAIGFPVESVVASDQTHTVHLRVAGREDCGKGVLKERDYAEVDGLLTNERGVALATFYADCVPLYFVDPVRRAIALSHSGWRGTVCRMGQVTAERMRKEYGTCPEDLITVIGPSICRDCYEVGEEVVEKFAEEFPEKLHGRLFRRKENGKYQLDLWEANRQVLLDAGIREDRIAMPGICTCCNPGFLFSHRASHGKRGNLGAFLMLK